MAAGIKWEPDKFLSELERAKKTALRRAAVLVVASVKKSFGSTGVPGATKAVRHAGRSRPGEPPHVDTGTLRRSITYKIAKDSAFVGSNVVYARALEMGYAPGGLAPRPYLRPVIDRERDEILACFRDIL